VLAAFAVTGGLPSTRPDRQPSAEAEGADVRAAN
jgi:hypothetical protein